MRGVPNVITSPIFEGLPVAHTFTTRVGGHATGVCAGGNMHYRRGGKREQVLLNRRDVLHQIGVDEHALRLVDQTHGRNVIIADGLTLAQTEHIPADGLVSTSPGLAVGVYVADCLPILVGSEKGVAALHGGWRSVAAGIVEQGIALLGRESGLTASRMRVAIGAGIGPCCFEVGDEVTAAFRERGLKQFILPMAGKSKNHIDLPGAAKSLAARAGIKPENIWCSPHCTVCEPERYYSYRREGWPTGQMMGIIALR